MAWKITGSDCNLLRALLGYGLENGEYQDPLSAYFYLQVMLGSAGSEPLSGEEKNQLSFMFQRAYEKLKEIDHNPNPRIAQIFQPLLQSQTPAEPVTLSCLGNAVSSENLLPPSKKISPQMMGDHLTRLGIIESSVQEPLPKYFGRMLAGEIFEDPVLVILMGDIHNDLPSQVFQMNFLQKLVEQRQRDKAFDLVFVSEGNAANDNFKLEGAKKREAFREKMKKIIEEELESGDLVGAYQKIMQDKGLMMEASAHLSGFMMEACQMAGEKCDSDFVAGYARANLPGTIQKMIMEFFALRYLIPDIATEDLSSMAKAVDTIQKQNEDIILKKRSEKSIDELGKWLQANRQEKPTVIYRDVGLGHLAVEIALLSQRRISYLVLASPQSLALLRNIPSQ